MDKESFESTEHNIPQPIREFAMSLPEDLKNKCIGLFSKFLPSLPLPIDLEEFSETLSIAEKAEFWKAVSQVQAQFVNPVPLPIPVSDEVSCDPSTNPGAAAPKNKWELSFVAPIIDEEGVPSRQFFSQLMEGIKAVKEPEKEKTPFLRSTDVQREVARKSIENNTFQNDKCLDEDQKAVITEFKRVWGKEKKRVACNKKFCIDDECMLNCLSVVLFFGTGTERDLSSNEFYFDLKECVRLCVEKRVKNWRRRKEWRWLMIRKEREAEKKIDKEEEERKKKEENEKLSREAAIEMEKLQMKQVMTAGTSGAGNDKFTNQAFSSSVAVEMEVGTEAIMKEDEYI
eukprot:MONOS_11031.1-p1 / transcript=MONOS_11031.1 / gene=MONOS_11031 / organism=Monocercomonoides_exilis_PA203 / gene_product=unspecified product / transcript_product=unspecified product / location=Mono_scaffold00529:36684-37931(+) / protein_length=343 / sequence_SO=supercontig / SO=protein_coding / is_pseudo=false